MLKLNIQVTGTDEFVRKLRRISTSLDNMQATMNDIGRESALYFSTIGYASQGGVFGEKWEPLSDKYAIIKAKLYPGRPPLVRTGEMQNSYGYQTTEDNVIVTNTAPQFPYHQSTKEPRSKIPRRATMGINDPIRRIIHTALNSGVRKKVEAA